MKRISMPTFVSAGLLLGMTALPELALAASGGESEGLPQFNTSSYPGQIFWLMVTFIVVYVFLSKVALPQVSDVLENRQETVQGDLDRAAKLKAEADEVHEAYEKSLEKAHAEARETISAAQAEITDFLTKKNDDFAKKAKKRMDQAESRINNAKNEAMDEVTQASAEIAAEAAKKVAGLTIKTKEAQMTIQAITKEERA